MNNGYQKSNGCGADKEGGKIFNTFFYPELQSKNVCPIAYNVLWLCVRWGFPALKPIDSTNFNLSTNDYR